jgi:dolichyl-phosphate-mannose--protein O-mannosyl transferase
VALSDDGADWSEEHTARMDWGVCFQWLEYAYPLLDENGEQMRNARNDLQWTGFGDMAARYVRITAQGMGLELFEVAFLNPEGGFWPVASVTSDLAEPRTPPEYLIDEQRLVPERSTYMNSTYFDEIYHARTGYEHLHRIHAFEWTHPPLGKLLIMASISVFGMTPFGWRFAGATMGVLMLPAIYLLAKQLWKRTDLAVFTTLLLALDSMHFTQARIATIDSYPVLFIMLMYWLMFRYMQMSFYHQKLWKTLIPLALCGTATGLAIASKWIGFYAAAGLALLLFFALYQRFAERRYALAVAGEEDALRRQTDGFARSTCITLGWCVLWFVMVPALIYYFSYYVHFLPQGGLNWTRFWNMQESIYSYHSGIVDDHAYQSKWWQWPIIAKPMWYYAGGRLADGRTSTILAFGNPAVWWGGLAALCAMIAYSLSFGLRRLRAGIRGSWLEIGEETRAMLLTATLLVIGFASQYLPWMLVPRSTYIYHYFASLPFTILCMAQCARMVFKGNRKLGYWVCGMYLALTLALFIGYYPFASGVPMSMEWARAMQWAFRLPY